MVLGIYSEIAEWKKTHNPQVTLHTSVAFSSLKSLPWVNQVTHKNFKLHHPAILLQRNYHKDINQNTPTGNVHSPTVFRARQYTAFKQMMPHTHWLHSLPARPFDHEASIQYKFSLDLFIRLRWHNRYRNLRNLCKPLYYFKGINMQKAYTWRKKATALKKSTTCSKSTHTPMLCKSPERWALN